MGTEGPLRLGREFHLQVRWLNQESATALAYAECQINSGGDSRCWERLLLYPFHKNMKHSTKKQNIPHSDDDYHSCFIDPLPSFISKCLYAPQQKQSMQILYYWRTYAGYCYLCVAQKLYFLCNSQRHSSVFSLFTIGMLNADVFLRGGI